MIGRRHFLSVLGAAVAGTTFATPTRGGPQPAAKRLVLIMQNNGTQQANFWPRAGFTSPILEPLLSVPELAKRTTVVRGLQMETNASGTSGNEHDMGFARMFTGKKLMSVAGEPWGAGPSVDQIVANAWDVDSLALAVHASEAEAFPKPGFSHRRSFSYVGPAMQKIPTLNPFDAYARFFATGSTTPEQLKARLARRRSVFDVNAAELRDLQARLGGTERAKLDAHATSIRQLEKQIMLSLENPSCGAMPVPFDYRAKPELLVSSDEAIPALVDTMVDLLATTIGCGIARVGSLQLGYGGGRWKFGWLGNTGENIHDKAHRDTSDEGSSPENTAILVAANRYYAGVVARLASKLAATPELDGSNALDHTLIVWANEFGRGDHDLHNIPLVLVGGPLEDSTGRGKLVDVGPQTFERLGCTILRSMGLRAETFGDLPEKDCGPLQGL